MLVPNPSILFIDAYDSFSNNIIALLKTELNATVRVLKIDTPIQDDALYDELSRHDAVVCGPGPGTPYKAEDVGVMNRIWKLEHEQIIPVLGICLGFQSMALAFGAKVRKLADPQHGMIRRIEHAGEDGCQNTIFTGVGEIRATLYQSLCVDIFQDKNSAEIPYTTKWQPSPSCPEIRPLAWVPADPSTRNGPILQGIQHITKPFWALQYHPESICTNVESRKVIRKWFRATQDWNKLHRQRCSKNEPPPKFAAASLQPSLLCIRKEATEATLGHDEMECPNGLDVESIGLRSVYSCRTIDRLALTVPDIVAALKSFDESIIVLESTNAQCSPGSQGRYSIIGLGMTNALRFEYKVGNDILTAKIQQTCGGRNFDLQQDIDIRSCGGVWSYLADFMEKRYISGCTDNQTPPPPFWGGLMGYTTYEMGLQGIDIQTGALPTSPSLTRADLCFAWIEDSIVIDHQEDLIHIQHLHAQHSKNSSKFHDIFNTIESHEKRSVRHKSPGEIELVYSPIEIPKPLPNLQASNIVLPQSSEYESKVKLCQECIRNGDSYELCLTDQTSVTVPRQLSGVQAKFQPW